MISYVAAQFLAGGKAFSTSFHVSKMSGILLTAVIVLVYTALGGFLAVSLTDMIQALFMIFALLVLPFIAIIQAGSWSGIVSIYSTASTRNSSIPLPLQQEGLSDSLVSASVLPATPYPGPLHVRG